MDYTFYISSFQIFSCVLASNPFRYEDGQFLVPLPSLKVRFTVFSKSGASTGKHKSWRKLKLFLSSGIKEV